ncbi:MAG: hypothetical protein KIT84_17380 [Labilithrix sp.]|nr:hypothetical protein [Labilithrix sp.]MCW5812804.1 hypothetical protein [Labilithrix sp.]
MRTTLVPALLVIAACSEPPPPKSPSKNSGEVPANSLDEAQLHGTAAKEEPPPNDPSQPLTTKVGEAPIDPDALAAGSATTTTTSSAPSKPAGKPGKPEPASKGAVSKAECDKAFDKYLQLEMAQNPQLKDLPPEVLEQVKEQGRQKHGEAPCTATRAQYNCAMAAGSTAAWQKCMK